MNQNEIINKCEEVILHTYNRFPIVFDKGDGVYLYDTDGNKYLDFVAGIAVYALGYGNTQYEEAIVKQVEKVMHISNYYYSVPMYEAAQKLVTASGLSKVFFTNSGAEAIEGAIKTARKYYYDKHGKADSEIIAMQHSFHGRTMGALSVTGTPKYREAFEPLIGNVKFAEYNNYESAAALVTDKTCAIILETVQGEGGIHPADKEYLVKLRKLCDDKDILLILDEVQCGMGRTGYMYAYQRFGILPDVMTTAKALGCGVPVGAFVCSEKAAAMGAGDHGSTYGGNPFVTAVVSKVFDLFEENNILENVKKVGEYLYKRLDEVAELSSHIVAHRGIGLIQALEFDIPVRDIINKCREKGLILINAGEKVIRFIPPLIISEANVDEMIEILSEAVKYIFQ